MSARLGSNPSSTIRTRFCSHGKMELLLTGDTPRHDGLRTADSTTWFGTGFVWPALKTCPSLTGKLIQEKALMLSIEMGYDDFTASNGWLVSFQKRHDIKAVVLSGESADVPAEAVDKWMERLPQICEGYQMKDIFNADETGLFFRTLPVKSLVVKGDSCKGGKKAKDRITALLACSATGEKLKPLVIGRSAKPRCMKGYSIPMLRVAYHNNKKAWMTSERFRTWVTSINNKMQREDRQILLFVNNCSAHPTGTYSNVKLVFLPPNTTSRLQPCDAGIIMAVKANYRKKMLRHLLFRMDEATTATDLAKAINVLDAVLWLSQAWEALSPSTIQKCFMKCGFQGGDNNNTTEEEEEEEEALDLAPLLGEVSLEDFTTSNDGLATHNTIGDEWEEDILQEARGIIKPEEAASEDEEEEAEAPAAQRPAPTPRKVMECLDVALDFGLCHNQPDLLLLMAMAKTIMETIQWKAATERKQTTMDTFLKPT